MKVAFVMGSDSDLPVVEKAIEVVKEFGVETEVRVISAHRTPAVAEAFAKNARENGIEVIIAAAGKAAHLGGVLAAYTSIPVIGLPILSSTLDGMDSLLSIVQMPPGIPVATVGINAGANAGLLAIQILSVKYEKLQLAMADYRSRMEEAVKEKDALIKAKYQ